MSYKRSFRPRGLVAFVVFGGFVVMTGTGLILFMTPPGRVAHWTDWALLGLEKTDWAAVHIVFSLLFVLVGLIHLVFNWKPFKNYLVNKFAGHLRLRYAGTGLGQKTHRRDRRNDRCAPGDRSGAITGRRHRGRAGRQNEGGGRSSQRHAADRPAQGDTGREALIPSAPGRPERYRSGPNGTGVALVFRGSACRQRQRVHLTRHFLGEDFENHALPVDT